MKWTSWLVLALGIFAMIGAGSQFATSAPLGFQGDEIRFVDINEAVKGYEKASKNNEEFKKAFSLQYADMQRREEELVKKQKELAPLDRNSTEYFQKARDLELEQMKLKRDGEYLIRERDRKRIQLLLSAYDEIRTAIKKYSEANRLKAVFLVEREMGLDGVEEDLNEKSSQAFRRQVLYYDPALDVTPQIIKILNSQ